MMIIINLNIIKYFDMNFIFLDIFLGGYVAISVILMKIMIIYILFGLGFIILMVVVFLINFVIVMLIISLIQQVVLVLLTNIYHILMILSNLQVFT